MSVTDRIMELAVELREAGAVISVAETADAVRALEQIPLERREVFKAALGAALVKDPGLRRRYDRLFDIFFPLNRRTRADAEGDGADRAELRERLSRTLKDMDPEALRRMAEELVDEEAEVDPEVEISDDYYRYRALRNMDIEDLIRRLMEEEIEGKGMSALQRKLIEEDFDERMKRFSEQVTEEIQRRRRQGIDLDRQLQRQKKPPPEEVDFLWAQNEDLEAMRLALYHLSRRLAATLSTRRRKSHRGRLDMRRTIRRSLSCGGVLLEPRFRRPTIGKPELWVLCDISGSMRSFARFTLELMYTLSTNFQRVRTFVFIDSLDEVSDKLSVAGHLGAALDAVDSQADVVHYDGQSWYGNCFTQFWDKYGRE
ncbi:MAG: VWA domain-containing protein, partial [Actinomycetota bacterium]